MIEANKAMVRRWFEEVWNQGREETIDELFAANGIGYGLGDTEAPVQGPAGIKPFVRNLRGALPDVHMEIEDSIAEGDKVTVRITGRRHSQRPAFRRRSDWATGAYRRHRCGPHRQRADCRGLE